MSNGGDHMVLPPPPSSIMERIVITLKGLRRNIWTFIVLYFIFNFTHGIQGSYISSVLTTLERNFNLPSSMSSIIVTIASVGYMSSAITVSFFLAHKHHVRLFAVCMLVTGFCGLVYFLTHFIFKDYQVKDSNGFDSNVEEIKLCRDLIGNNESYVDSCANNKENESDNSPNYVALMMFCVSEIFHGAAGACLWTIGLSFIDDHMPVQISSKLIGLLFLVRYFSPVISSTIGSSFLSIHTDLIETTLTPSHPQWIGAWWLGYLLCFAINILISIPTFFLPEQFDNAYKQKPVLAVSGDLKVDVQAEVNESTVVKVYHDKSFKDLCSALNRLVHNPVFMFSTVGICFDCYILAYYAFLPKYIEIYFQLTAWMASILGVLIPAISAGISSYIGGLVSGRLKPSLDSGVTKNMIISCTLSISNVIVLLFIMLLQCPNNGFPHGYSELTNSVNLELTCNNNCSCSTESFDPICGSDHIWYTSPCHAGCLNFTTNHNGSTSYSNCACIPGHSSTAKQGYCDDSCTSILVVYTLSLIFFCIVNNGYNVPLTNVILKCVDEEDKSLALGIQLILVCIAMLPSPLIYGQLIDYVCILWKTSPCSSSVGSCLAYDRSKFRLILHGNTIIWRFLAALFYVTCCVLAHRKLKKLKLQEANDKILQNRVCEILANENNNSLLEETSENRF